jgi:hypothetical protein
MRRAAAGWTGADSAASFFRLFCRCFAAYGCRIRRGQTAREYLNELKRRRLLANEFDDLVDYLYAVCYAGQVRSMDRERDMMRRVKAWRRRHPRERTG